MKLRVLLVPGIAAMFVLGACGDDSGSGSSSATTIPAAAAGSTAAPAAAGGGGYAIPSDATATSAAASGGGATAADTVVAKSIAYNPDKITVKVGDTVTFKNDDSFAHTFTADNGEFDSNNVDGGGSFQFTTDKAGTIAFHCKIHSNMHGTITVTS
jgi:plastocyanin